MSLLKSALQLARFGFYVFPVRPNSKKPALVGWQKLATRDLSIIKKWWDSKDYNIGISTSNFSDDKMALVVVDVDNKDGKNGDEVIKTLIEEGKNFPKTFTQFTPTGGRHLIYWAKEAAKQGEGVLGEGLDIRSRGGLIVGSGSIIEGLGEYTHEVSIIEECPQWIIHECNKNKSNIIPEKENIKVDEDAAYERAKHYLEQDAPLALEGSGGDATTFKVACWVKDIGVNFNDCNLLMAEYWNDKCEPPWDEQELETKIRNAYSYSKDKQGSSSPEADFGAPTSPPPPKPKSKNKENEAKSPIEKMNKEHAFITIGGSHHIIWETKDVRDEFLLVHMNEISFHKKFAAQTMSMGDGKTKPITEIWMKSPDRRSYNGLCFRPGLETPSEFYNLWRGFTVEPTPVDTGSKKAVKGFYTLLEHIFENICNENRSEYDWVMNYFAHMIQKPYEKPLVSLVLKGGKGVGKNAFVEPFGSLLGNHYLLASNRRYLVGNFNGYLESCVLLVLDEAFWSGDKQSEGTLKDLVTGKHHLIERKGKEVYKVANCTRVIILGNEEWLVPASSDERRYTVLNVGDKKKQKNKYFQKMREGLEAGGLNILLHYLSEYKVNSYLVNEAPQNEALLIQKQQSLEPIYQWWFDCLNEGEIHGAGIGFKWGGAISKTAFRDSFKHYLRDRQINSRIQSAHAFGHAIRRCLPDLQSRVVREGENIFNAYVVPSLGECRAFWEKFIGHVPNWEEPVDIDTPISDVDTPLSGVDTPLSDADIFS